MERRRPARAALMDQTNMKDSNIQPILAPSELIDPTDKLTGKAKEPPDAFHCHQTKLSDCRPQYSRESHKAPTVSCTDLGTRYTTRIHTVYTVNLAELAHQLGCLLGKFGTFRDPHRSEFEKLFALGKHFKSTSKAIYKNELAPSGKPLCVLMVIRDIKRRWNYMEVMMTRAIDKRVINREESCPLLLSLGLGIA
ncbi:hypothetical protein K438DRAFT_1925059 [Mycena galopus ATCC 62051]|nr:hypothetical protein K438DRAFT_1925059 [Mycena galopus ATCC 62051]